MALMSYVQRRRSGVYEFRKRLPQALAGKDVPPHIRAGFPDLVNAATGKFKHEFVQSLQTKEAAGAKRQAHRIALRLTARIDEASQAIAVPPTPTSAKTVNAKEVGEAVYRRLLADDETERLLGDDRRLIGLDRAELWPDLEPLRPASGFGMQIDHAAVYEEETAELAKEYRAAYARRDPSIVFAETMRSTRRPITRPARCRRRRLWPQPIVTTRRQLGPCNHDKWPIITVDGSKREGCEFHRSQRWVFAQGWIVRRRRDVGCSASTDRCRRRVRAGSTRPNRARPGVARALSGTLLLLLALCVRLLAVLAGRLRVLLRAAGVLLALRVIALAVQLGGGTMGLGRVVVVLGRLVVLVSCHGELLGCRFPSQDEPRDAKNVPEG